MSPRSVHFVGASLVAALALLLVLSPRGRAADVVRPLEAFALAADRADGLGLFTPGTEDHFYFHALADLHAGRFEAFDARAAAWRAQHGETGRWNELAARRALLAFDRDPAAAFAFLRRRLDLRYDHRKEAAGGPVDLPTALPPAAVARDTLRAAAVAGTATLDNFEDAALDWLAAGELSAQQRRNLLQRLAWPDAPGLVKLVSDDLGYDEPRVQFGAHPVHAQMTAAQLDELLGLRPDLLNQDAFVRISLTKLHPGADSDWKRDRAAAAAYFDRLQAFVGRLGPVHNALKAHVLYHRLRLDQARGVADKPRFLGYLALPRRQPYMRAAWSDRDEARQFPADLGADYAPATLLPPVRADEELVRALLKQFLAAGAAEAEFAPFVDAVYLKHLAAEARVEAGTLDPAAAAREVPAGVFQAHQDRVDIDFAPTNKTEFAADEPVTLDLFVKNVPSLLVKVFEVNTRAVYRATGREIDTDVNLDGLVANAETTHRYADAPGRRVARSFALPDVTKPGVYVVDFIGAGRSSRALVRKGRYRSVVTTGPGGQVVTVVDEANKPVPDAAVWLGGQEYTAGKDGTVMIPFTAAPGRRPVVLSRGEFASLDVLDHAPEAYSLAAGLFVDREQLLTQRVAKVVVRPQLLLGSQPVSLSRLDDVRLRVASVDHAGVPTTTEIPDVKLFDDRETTHDVRVPPRLATLTVTLTARVRPLTGGPAVELNSARTFAVNGFARTDRVEDVHFARFGPDYALEVLGRTGERHPDRTVRVSLKHRDFRKAVDVALKTDARGRVALGRLADVQTVTATGPDGASHTWAVPQDRHTHRAVLHARAGETVQVPYLGAAAVPGRDEFALFEVVNLGPSGGRSMRADRFDALSLNDGMLELRGLEPGDYELHLKRQSATVRVRVAAGVDAAGHVLGRVRQLERARLAPVGIQSVTADADAVTVRVRNATPFTRVHVFARRYAPAFDTFGAFSRVRAPDLAGVYPGSAESAYLGGRDIGDEYRYVLDRRGQKPFPGNMLARPQLLLNPWTVRLTESGEQVAAGGTAFGGAGAVTPPAPVTGGGGRTNSFGLGIPGDGFGGGDGGPDLDFLADPSAAVLNLVPDKDGVVRVPRKAVGPHAMVEAVAVDPLGVTSRHVSLPEVPALFADLRLKTGLDPAKAFAETKQVSVLEPGKPFVLADAAGGRFQLYDSLPKVLALYATLLKDPRLAEFAFVGVWPAKSPAEKRALYSKYACHELNVFLAKKDPQFFAEVVRPYLLNKKDKTFVDHYLVGADLAAYRDPWAFGRLNTAERVLLAGRTPGGPARTARHLADLLRLQPPQADRDRFLFEAGVQGGDLSAGMAAVQANVNTDAKNRQFERSLAPADPKAPAGDIAKALPPIPSPPGAPAPSGPAAEPQRKEGQEAARDLDGEGGGKMKERDGDAEKKLKDAGGDKTDAVRGLKLDREQMFFEAMNAAERAPARPLYRKVDPTEELAENNYYKLPVTQQVAALVPVGPFWADYARHDGKGPFLSPHFPGAARNFSEAMLALAVLDLPFTPGKHDIKFDAGKMTLSPASRGVAFHEEVRPAAGKPGTVPVLVSENFYKQGDRFKDEAGEKVDKFVTAEFVARTVYGSQVVVTNPTSARQRLTVLVQVPVGSVPVAGARYTRGVPLDLEPYRTGTVDTLFYFPTPGEFAHYPATVAKDAALLASAKPTTFQVVATPSKPDGASWDVVSQEGTTEDVLAFLARENVHGLNLDKIAFRMTDRAAYEAVVKLLGDRHAYSPVLWSYSLLHADVPTAKQFLQHSDDLAAQLGGPIASPLLTIDPVARHTYEHLEYKPLVNARAHALGPNRQIVNARVHEQYHRFLRDLSLRPAPTDADRLTAVHYLLLQDRVEEALALFGKVDGANVSTKLQYDYCAAYLDLFGDDPVDARALAAKYKDHPVDRWREAFAAVGAHVAEADGKVPAPAPGDDPARRQGEVAAAEPAVEFTLDGKAVQLTARNVAEVRVNYYLMDVELLFSRGPFARQSAEQFAVVRPNATEVVKVAAGGVKQAVPIPPALAAKNVLIEVTGGGRTRSAPYYANAMNVELTETYGRVRAADAAGKPVSKAYVKVYARLADGRVVFHKDGYTDLRGRFDYATVSGPGRPPVERFAVLVLADGRGAVTREAAPPQQ